MLFSTPRKSRFFNETQQNLNKTPNEEESDNTVFRGNRQNSNRKLIHQQLPPINTPDSQDVPIRRRESAYLRIPSHIPLIQENPDEQEEDEDLKDNQLKRRDSLPPKSFSRSKSEEPKEGAKTERLTYKTYRDKLAITVTPPRPIRGFSKRNEDAVTEVLGSDPDANNEGDGDHHRDSLGHESASRHGGSDDSISREDPQTRALRLQRTLKRALNATYFIGSLIAVSSHIKVHGSIRKTNYLQKEENKKIKEKRKSFLPLLPTDTFKVFWNVILVFLLFMSALLTPFTVSFIDDNNQWFNIITDIFDIGFGIDIAINFISAYNNSTFGLVTDLRQISLHYLKGWFFFDLILVIPIDSIAEIFATGTSSSVTRLKKLLRLLRFPRIYRIMRVLRLFKMAKLFITNRTVIRMLNQFSLNIGLIKMSQVLINLLFLNHIAACIWFLFSRLSNFSPDTWVARSNLIDSDVITQYIASYYWAFQTLTTVGYGDINAGTTLERALAMLWMLVGVCLYSFAIANLSTILQNMDRRSSILRNKITAFNNFAAKVKLPEMLRQKVQRFFELNHKENIYYWMDPQDLIEDLPQNLRQSLLLYTYYPMIQSLKLLQLDANFTAAIVTELKLLKLIKNEILYREEDPAQEVYFISKGSVKFVLDDGQGIFSLVEGTYFGEIEILEDTKRIAFCQAMEATLLLVCSRAAFLKALKKCPKVEAHIRKSAQLRKEKFDNKIADLQGNDESKRGEDSMSHASTKRLLKSTDYFYSIVNNSNKRKRFSRLSSFDPEENWSKRGSEIIPYTPKMSTRSKMPETAKNAGDKSFTSFNELPEKDIGPTTKKKLANSLSLTLDKDFKSKLAKSLTNKGEENTLLQSKLSQHLSNLIKSKKLTEGDAPPTDTARSSIYGGTTPTNANQANAANQGKKIISPGKINNPFLNFDLKDEKRKSHFLAADFNVPFNDNEEFRQKRQLIKEVDQNFFEMNELKTEIDNLYSNFEVKKNSAVNYFDTIAQRQKELDEIVEKLFEMGR